MTRLKINRQIMQKLYEYLEKNPDLRFQQALDNLDINVRGCDLFYEESSNTLERMEKSSVLIHNKEVK